MDEGFVADEGFVVVDGGFDVFNLDFAGIQIDPVFKDVVRGDPAPATSV